MLVAVGWSTYVFLGESQSRHDGLYDRSRSRARQVDRPVSAGASMLEFAAVFSVSNRLVGIRTHRHGFNMRKVQLCW